jgi:nanoRNase/pAp phosphatase (c-di-AMP/oligoRNAs hydrolase)
MAFRRIRHSFFYRNRDRTYRAMAKLKHAYDLWNSRIFLVGLPEEKPKVDTLLSGTLHEIRERLRFVDIAKVGELYSRKRAYKEMEEQLGIY